MPSQTFLVSALSITTVCACVYAYTAYKKYIEIKRRFSGIIDTKNEIDRIIAIDNKRKEDLDRLLANKTDEFNRHKEEIELTIEQLRLSYKEKKEIYDRLIHTISIYDDQVTYIELGLYKPHYDFDTSDNYKTAIDDVRQKQKDMIANKQAIICNTEWTINNSKSQGRTMTNRAIRLTARAFNNECEAAIANTRWNNAAKMEQRILKAFETINKLNESSLVFISQDYLALKLSEFRLAFEHQEKKQEEKEEQAAIRQQLREEERLLQDAEKAKKEEESFQKLLHKAKRDAEKLTGEKLYELEEKIRKLTSDLAAAHEKSERAISMAEQTKSGHVYVISNIGSFGEDVYKIGMTRRLEPSERVYELGNASVPFVFDIHAMIYSEDAPALENKLHKVFNDKRINLVNNRKEFFKVDIEEIKDIVTEKFPDAAFILTPEARQYRETKIIQQKLRSHLETSELADAFPAEI